MEIQKQAEQFGWQMASQDLPWYHVTPHKLPYGTKITPGGGQSPFTKNFSGVSSDSGGVRGDHVYVTGPNNVGAWLEEMLNTRRRNRGPGLRTPVFVYEVGLDEMEMGQEGLGGNLGYTVPKATAYDVIGRGRLNDAGDYVPEPNDPDAVDDPYKNAQGGDTPVNWMGLDW